MPERMSLLGLAYAREQSWAFLICGESKIAHYFRARTIFTTVLGICKAMVKMPDIYIYIYYKKANELLLSVKEMMEDKVMDIKPTR